MRDEPNMKVMAVVIALVVVVAFLLTRCTDKDYKEITLEQYTEVGKLSEGCPNALAASKEAMKFGSIKIKDYKAIKEAGEECRKEGKAKSDAAKIEEQKDKLRRMMNNQ